jgi:hypothetical protein
MGQHADHSGRDRPSGEVKVTPSGERIAAG